MAAPTPKKSLNLAVSNFGPIIEADIDLRPLTVFVGPSNTGKSYMATLIYALQRFFSGGYAVIGPPHSLVLSDLKPSGFPARSDVPKNVREDMVAWLERAAGVFETQTFPKSVESLILQSLDISGSHGRAFMEELRRYFGKDNLGQLTRHGSGEKAKVAIKSSVGEDAAASLEYEIAIAENGGSEFRSSTPKAMPAEISGLASVPYTGNSWWINSTADYADAEYSALKSVATAVSDEFIAPLNSLVHYIPAGRTNIVHAYPLVMSSLAARASQSTTFPVLSGVVADFLQNLIVLGNPAERQISQTTTGLVFDIPRSSHNNPGIQKVADRIEKIMLAGAAEISESPTGYSQFRYRPNGWKDALPLMSASSMVSEVAPVILYLRHVVSPGDTLIIEEPESHLHPAMQVEFIRQLAAVTRAGVRVILTTHSEWVLNELSNLTLLSQLHESRRDGIPGADCALDPKSVGVWLFRPKKRPKGSAVAEIPFDDEYGGYSESYGDIALDAYNSHAEIFNRIQEAKGE